jgi:hypothetical protein
VWIDQGDDDPSGSVAPEKIGTGAEPNDQLRRHRVGIKRDRPALIDSLTGDRGEDGVADGR